MKKKLVHTKVQHALIEIFQEVADTCDANESVLASLRLTYKKAMKVREVQEFYGNLVEDRYQEVWG